MKKTTLMLILLAIISKFVGLTRDIALSFFYGTSNISDVYIVSITIPAVIFSFVMMGISSGYIPTFSRVESEQGNEAAIKFTNNLITLLLLLCSAIALFGLLFAEQIVVAFASGFRGDTLALAVRFTRVSLFSIYFVGMSTILTDFLRMRGNYIAPSVVSLVPNLLLIILIFLSFYFNVIILALSTLIVAMLNFLFLLPLAYKKGFRYKWYCKLNNDEIKNMVILALPLIIGVSVNQINVLVDRTIASQLVIGGISSLTYAGRLSHFVQGIFVLSITNVMFPIIARKASVGDIKGFKESIKESINSISLLVVPATIGMIVFSYQIINLLFGRGAFSQDATSMTSSVLLYYAIGMIGIGFREVLARSFYSLNDTKTPMINASFAVILNIALNLILSRLMGITGLALATSISALFCTGALFISLRKKIGPFGMKQISISFLKIIFASLVMGALAKLSFNYLTTFLSQNFSLLLSIGIGAVSYFMIIYFMKIEDVDVIVGAINKKFGIDSK